MMQMLRLPICLVMALYVSSAWTQRKDRNEAWKFFLRSALVKVQQSDTSATTCREASLSPGCCQWQGQTLCFVPDGDCYCDNLCRFFGDCCCDVPATPPCDFVPSSSGSETNRCSPDTTTPSEPTPTVPTTTAEPLPPTCAANNLNTGADGCCSGGPAACFIENDGGCYCDRTCHKEKSCCSDVKSNGCYPRNCSEAGINGSTCSGDGCRVQTSHNSSCYCDQECMDKGDCCSDATPANSQIQNLSEPDEDQMENLLAVIESDNSALYEKMAAAFWRRYNKMKRRQQQMASQNRRM